VFERREVLPQAEALSTQGHLVRVDSGFESEDTLHSFIASGYGMKRGGVMVCCGPPLLFSPQSHWVQVADDQVAFSDGGSGLLLLLPLSPGLRVDSIRLNLAPMPPGDWDVLRYALRQASTRPDWSRFRQWKYALQAARSIDYLREQFSGRTPLVTQLFAVGDDELWIRHFDPGAWEYGLADLWTVVDLGSRTLTQVRTPQMGLVHDVRASAKGVVFLSSHHSHSDGTLLEVITFTR
jgi:hypothetical protein